MVEMLRKKLEATAEAFSDERVRWLIGKSRELIASSAIDEKTLDNIIRMLIKDEIEIHLILAELKGRGPLTDKEIAEAIDLPDGKVRDHLKVLRFLNEVSVVEGKEDQPLYTLSPIMAEERRRCPCEALVKALLRDKKFW